jgi:hypothetical protein
VNARLHVSGGALGGGRMVEDSSSVAGSSFNLEITDIFLKVFMKYLKKYLALTLTRRIILR